MKNIDRFGYASQEDWEYYQKSVAERMSKPENIQRQLDLLVAQNKPEYAATIAELRARLADLEAGGPVRDDRD